MEEKKPKNRKVNLGGSYKFKIAKKYSKPKSKGDKVANSVRKNNSLLFLISISRFFID